MNNILKYFSFLFTLTLIMSCGGGGGEDGGGDTGGGDVTVNPPAKSTLSAPANSKTCETGTSVSSTQSDVDFTWGVSADTDSYDLKITDLNSNVATNKTGLTTTSTKVTLDKGVPYSWFVTSKSTKSSVTTPSDTWKFYLAGTGVANYAPFPADLKAPSSGSTLKRTDGKVTFTWEGSDPDSGDTRCWHALCINIPLRVYGRHVRFNKCMSSMYMGAWIYMCHFVSSNGPCTSLVG